MTHEFENISMAINPPIEVGMDYVDAEGAFSRRRVSIQRIDGTGRRPSIQCYDLDRRAPRTFIVDRIQCFIDADGEVFDPLQVLRAALAGSNAKFATLGIQELGDPTPEHAAPAKPNRLSAILFWTLIAAVGAFSYALFSDEKDIGLAVFAFTLLAAPMFLIRWIFRTIKRRIAKRAGRTT